MASSTTSNSAEISFQRLSFKNLRKRREYQRPKLSILRSYNIIITLQFCQREDLSKKESPQWVTSKSSSMHLLEKSRVHLLLKIRTLSLSMNKLTCKPPMKTLSWRSITTSGTRSSKRGFSSKPTSKTTIPLNKGSSRVISSKEC